MSGTPRSRSALILVLGAVLFTVWGAIGLGARKDAGIGGFTYNQHYEVSRVAPRGPAEKVGIRLGDRVISVEGRPVDELPMQSRWRPPQAGQSYRFVLERDGERVVADLEYRAAAGGRSRRWLVATVVGWATLALGVWAMLTLATPSPRLLALIGLSVLAAAGQGPYAGPLEGAASHVRTFSIAMIPALLMSLFMVCPSATRFADSRRARFMMRGMAVTFGAFLLLELLVHPALYDAYGVVAFLLAAAFALAAIVTLMGILIKVPLRRWREEGLGLVLTGLAVALVPPLAQAIGGAVAPGLRLPGASYFGLLTVAVPGTMAMAIRRAASGKAVSSEEGRPAAHRVP